MTEVASYTIRARLQVDDQGLDKVEGRLSDVETSAMQAGRSMRGLNAAVLGMTATAAGAVGLITWATRVGAEAETAQSSIQAVLMAVDQVDAAVGRKQSKTIFAQLSEDAAKGVGEVENYLEAYQMMFSPLRGAGAGDGEIRAFVSQSLTAGFALRGQQGLQTAPMDIVQAMTAGAGDRTTPIVVSALRAAGMDTGDFNAAEGGDRLGMLKTAFGSFDEAAKVMGETFEAQSATAQDSMKRLERAFAQPIFEEVKDKLGGLNGGLDAYGDEVASIAESSGRIVSNLSGIASESGINMLSRLLGIEGGSMSPEEKAQALAVELEATTDDLVKMRPAITWLMDNIGAGVQASALGPGGAQGVRDGLTAGNVIRIVRETIEGGLDTPLTRTLLSGNTMGMQMSERMGLGPMVNVAADPGSMLTRKDVFLSGLGPTLGAAGSMDRLFEEVVPEMLARIEGEAPTGKPPPKVEVKVRIDRIEWGNDRSMAIALGSASSAAVERAMELNTSSSFLGG